MFRLQTSQIPCLAAIRMALKKKKKKKKKTNTILEL